MQKWNKIKNKAFELVTSFYRRHKTFCIVTGSIILLYIIIRIFFISPILSQTHFAKAYYDRDGKLLRLTISEDEKYRIFTPLSQISPALQKATILYEDKNFWYHFGVNPVALFRAANNHFFVGGRQIGASTITMQVARLRYDLNTKTTGGKLKQILYAIQLEVFHSKKEILEAYLNLAPYGGNIEGIGAASLIYFEKRANDLSTIEAITLSTIPQNPIKRGLLSKSGLDNIMHMRHDLVARWIARYPDDTNLKTLASMPLAVGKISDLPFYAPHFVDREISQKNNYWRDLGKTDSEITTTLDLGLQKRLERSLQSAISKHKYAGVENAAAVLVNYKTMEVISHVGSANYFDKKILGENDGVHAKRSPGSTLKPLIYAAAVDRGLIHGMTLLKDAQINFGVYAPENSDSEFYGPVLARDALTHSRNIPAIELTRKIGTRSFYNLLKKFDIAGLKGPEHYGISIALGGAELSMMELADIYAATANLGTRHKIKTNLNEKTDTGVKILSPESFFLVLDMLGSQGTLERKTPFAKKQKDTLNHYWKTGTSSSFRDAWTAGIFGDYVLIVWVGNFNGKPNNAFSGAKMAAPLYFNLANVIQDYHLVRGTPISNPNFYKEDMNISRIDMCDKVGGLAGTHCQKKVQAYFIPGKSPIETSSIYRSIPVDKKTGRRACAYDPKSTRMETFEFWDPEYLEMFNNAGIKRKTPPAFLENCDLDDVVNQQSKPVIVSPVNKTKIVILSGQNTETVSFKAISGLDRPKIFWFLNNEMIGTSIAGEVFQYKVSMGDYKLRAIDEMGGVTEIKFNVVK